MKSPPPNDETRPVFEALEKAQDAMQVAEKLLLDLRERYKDAEEDPAFLFYTIECDLERLRWLYQSRLDQLSRELHKWRYEHKQDEMRRSEQ